MARVLNTAEDRAVAEVAAGTSGNPFAVLGRHVVTIDQRPAVVVRTMQPMASAVDLVTDDQVTPMPRRHPEGLFEARLPLDGRAPDFAYWFRVHDEAGVREIIDPYQFGQVLSDYDLHLFSEGTHLRAWEKFGAHVMTICRRHRRALRGMGAERSARERSR